MYPENLAETLKSDRKNLKNCAITSFRLTERVHQVSKIFMAWQAHNKMFNLDSEYSHIHNASEKETQTRHFRSQEPAKVDDSYFYSIGDGLNIGTDK